MENLKKLFPFKANAGDVKSLVIAILLYIVIGVVAGIVLGILGVIPFIGLIFQIVGALVDIYCLGGIIIAVLTYCNVI